MLACSLVGSAELLRAGGELAKVEGRLALHSPRGRQRQCLEGPCWAGY